MSRIAERIISSDDYLNAFDSLIAGLGMATILNTGQGGTGQDTSAKSGLVMLTSGTWRFIDSVVDIAGSASGGTGTVGAPWTGWETAVEAISANGTALFRDGYYTAAVQVDCATTIHILLQGARITGPSTGYLFDMEANDSEIIGASGAVLTATAGCSGMIRNNQTQRCRYWNFKIDPNNVQNSKIFHHDGGWYIDVKNLEILKANEHATTVSLYIQSTNTGVAGTTGSYGGAYVGTYENVVANTIQLDGSAPTKVTTMTFINPDTSGFVADDCLAITCLQPVVQKTGGTLFDFSNVSGWTNLGGDFEGVGSTIYTCASSTRGIISIGNQISGAGNTYFNGLPTANSRFFDDDTTAVTGIIKGNIGSTEPFEFGNYGFTVRHRLGTNYVGTENTLAANLQKTSATEATLDDVSDGGMALSLNTSGQLIGQYASAGANPRTLVKALQVDALGLWVAGIQTHTDNAAAVTAGLTAGQFYCTATGQLMIVY